MDRRRSPRVCAHLPVRVWGVDAHDLPFMQLAIVKNLSTTGAVIQGMLRQVRPGEILEVQLDQEKAQFRVIWSSAPGTCGAGEIGLETMDSEPSLWGVALGCYSELVAEG
ncbi:MAG TPA: PilZ domain-containing protein [Terriglobales bacterium]|jgi:hypothetical protein|nr:PilZ domain-containing protein [Terriglobales bacterium]